MIGAGIKIQGIQPQLNRTFMFLDRLTVESLINDIVMLSQDVNLIILTLSKQRDRILFLNAQIKHYIETVRDEIMDYKTKELLDSVKHFIVITDKSISGFNIEVQLVVDHKLYNYKLKRE